MPNKIPTEIRELAETVFGLSNSDEACDHSAAIIDEIAQLLHEHLVPWERIEHAKNYIKTLPIDQGEIKILLEILEPPTEKAS